MNISESEIRELLIYAFRYTLGRSTYAPHTVIKIIKNNLQYISESDKILFKREIKEAIEHDMAGMDVDKNAWIDLLERMN